jgi:hypothetical protein
MQLFLIFVNQSEEKKTRLPAQAQGQMALQG